MTSPRRLPFRRDPSRRDTPDTEPVFDPTSWFGALVVMTAVAAVLWVVQGVNSAHRITQYGLRPRTLKGLEGVVTMPFLHSDWHHLFANTLPFILIGWVVLLAGLRTWAIVTAVVIVLGGLLTWLVAPSGHTVVGASGLVFGWLAYLLARAVFSREFKWIVVAVAVVFFFGTLLFGLFPSLKSTVSWQAHLCGFLAGVAVAFAMHRRRGETRLFRRSVS